MSFLEKQKASFSGALASASSRLSVKSAAFAPASPASSIGSAAGRKNTTPSKAKPAADGIDDTNTIILLMTYVHEYLRQQTEAKTGPEIMRHLEQNMYMRDGSVAKYQKIIDALRAQVVVRFVPDPSLSEQKWDSGSYVYLGKLGGIKDKVGLLAHLQAKSTMDPLQYKELKEGWPQCDAALLDLEREHKIIMVREKKGPKHIFIDDPTLHHKVEVDFLRMWQRVNVPAPEDLVKKLVAAGQKPASADPSLVKQADGGIKKKKRANRRTAMTTNVHMQHLLKDFSGQRK